MKQNVLDRKAFLYHHRPLIYLAALMVGATAGLLVGNGGNHPVVGGKLAVPNLPSLPGLRTSPTSSPRVAGQVIPPPGVGDRATAQKTTQTGVTQNPINFTVPPQFQGKVVNGVSINSNRKIIALTFDDGPWSSTEKVLNILKENQIPATFFMVGKHISARPQIAQKVVLAGHAVGNHTWSHQYGKYTTATAAAEIQRTSDLLYQATGTRTTLFRPPAGILNNGLAAYAQSQKGTVIMWSNDSLDWRSHSSQAITSNVVKNARSGSIVLLHDGGGDRSRTIAALPGIIRELKKQGYEFVTVPQLLEIKNQELQAKQG
jgi:chitin deacetylase